MSDLQSPVDPRDLELLRGEPAPDAATRTRVRARLAAVVPMGVAPPLSGPRPAPGPGVGAPNATRSVAWYATKAALFVTGGVVGAALYAGLAKPPPPRVVYVDRPMVQPPSPAVPPAAETGPVAAPPPSAANSVVPPSAAPRSHASQLSAERILLDEARAAIAHGDPQRGLDRIERHRRLFPTPLLAEERDALQVQALVKAERYDEARARADSFRRRTPNSLFLPMVDAAIDSIP